METVTVRSGSAAFGMHFQYKDSPKKSYPYELRSSQCRHKMHHRHPCVPEGKRHRSALRSKQARSTAMRRYFADAPTARQTRVFFLFLRLNLRLVLLVFPHHASHWLSDISLSTAKCRLPPSPLRSPHSRSTGRAAAVSARSSAASEARSQKKEIHSRSENSVHGSSFFLF